MTLADIDADLTADLGAERLELASRMLMTRVAIVPAGEWAPDSAALGGGDGLGLLVAEGLLVRRVGLGHRSAGELLGAGDVLRPWDEIAGWQASPFTASFVVVESLRVAMIDAALTARLMHFPEVVGRLMERVMARSRRATQQLAMAQIATLEARMHVLLWHLAERFGRVRSDGTFVALALTHETLGLLAGARRPSVTAALGALERTGLVEVVPGVGWLLKGDPPLQVPRRGHRVESRGR